MGRRRQKNDQRFFYDEYLQIVDNGGNAYIWDCTETMATRPLSWLHDSAAAYYMVDGSKNVSEAVNGDDGEIVAHYEYASFGSILSQQGTFSNFNLWHFSSEYDDVDLGCEYYNFRHYEKSSGRCVVFDPVERNTVDNLYCMFANNPLLNFDYLGRETGNKSSESEWKLINGKNDAEFHVYNCIEFNGKGTKDQYIKHFKNLSFSVLPKKFRSVFAYNLVNRLGMDQDSKACWCLVLHKFNLFEKKGARTTIYKLKTEVITLDKHPSCCATPEEHQTAIEGSIIEVTSE